MNLLRPVSSRRFAVALLLVAVTLFVSAVPALAQGPSGRASLIIEYGDGTVDALCVDLARNGMTGVDLLQASGLTVGIQSGGLGAQICQIGAVGCEPGREACWCQCLSNPCIYWTYFQWKDGAWAYAPLGASRRVVSDGDADAWVWGDGKTPPVSSPDLACATQQEPTPEPAATALTPGAATTTAAATADTAPATATAEPAPVPTVEAAAPSVARPGFGCSSPALVLLPLAALALAALWRR